MNTTSSRFNRLSISIAVMMAIPVTSSAVEIGPIGTVTGSTPEVRWIDTGSAGTPPDIEMELLSDAWTMDQDGGVTPFLEIGRDAPSDSLVIDDDGDMGVSLSNSGLSATQPQSGINLHVGGGQVLLDSFASAWQLNPGSTGLFFLDDNNRFPFRINNGNPFSDVLVVTDGRVGVGTGTPAKRFHVRGADSSLGGANTVAGLVENTTGATGIRTLFELVNNGDPRFRYVNTANGQSWALNPLNGEFRIVLDGSGVSEFRLSPGGNLRIAGTLTEGSDQALKQSIKIIDAKDVLDKVSSMPISEWSYKAAPGDRHIGPMAQDFHAAFGLGADEKLISPRDLASVSLVAIQAQQELINQQAVAIDALTHQLTEIQAVMDSLQVVGGDSPAR